MARSALRTFNTSQALNLEMKYQNVVCSDTDMKLFLDLAPGSYLSIFKTNLFG